MPIKPLNRVFKFFDPGRYKPGTFSHLVPHENRGPSMGGMHVRDGEPGPIERSKWKYFNGEPILVIELYAENVLINHYRDEYGQLPGLGWYTPKRGANPVLVYIELRHQLLLEREPLRKLKIVASDERTPIYLHKDEINFVGSRHLNSLERLSPEKKKIFNLYMRDHPEQVNWIDCWQYSLGRQESEAEQTFWNKVLVQQKFEWEDIKEAMKRSQPTQPELWLNIYVPCGYGHKHGHPRSYEIAIEANTAVSRADFENGGEMEFLDPDFWLRVLREAQREKAQMDVWSQEWQTQLPLTWPAIPLPRYYYNKWHKVDKKAAIELGFKIDESITTPLMDPILKSLK